MTGLEQVLQSAFDTAAADVPISADPWPRQQELIKQRRYRPRRERSWVWVGLTIAAACLVLLTVLLIVPAVSGVNRTPPAHPSPSPAPLAPPTAEQQFARSYLHRCLSGRAIASAAQADPRVSPRGAIVRLVGTDRWGKAAVVTTPTAIGVCEVDTQGVLHANGLLPLTEGTPSAIDAVVTEETAIPPRSHGVPRTQGSEYDLRIGRVASNVVRVEWVVAGRTVARATVGNGVYVLRVPVSVDAGGQRVAYDVSGRVVWNDSYLPLKQLIPWP